MDPVSLLVGAAGLAASVVAFTVVGIAQGIVQSKADQINQRFVEHNAEELKNSLDNIEKRNYNQKLNKYI